MSVKTSESLSSPAAQPRLHYAWVVAGTTFVVLTLSASVRGAFSLLIEPLRTEYGWSRTSIAAASTINLILFGLMGPVAAALIIRFGLRKVVMSALCTVAAGALLATQATQVWHLWLSWGMVMGIGQGCLATVLAASVSSTWFVERRAMVAGLLIAAGTAGTLLFLPLNRWLVDHYSWHQVSFTIAAAMLAALPLVFFFILNQPEDKGLRAYGAPADYATPDRPRNPIRLAWSALTLSVRSGMFWILFGSFTVCGITTSGMVQTHFVDAAKDSGIKRSTAASLIVVIGVFDLLGALGSGWLSDRYDPRKLLFGFYALRGLSLLIFQQVLSLGASNFGLLVVLALYGLDWVATVPPTVKLANDLFPGKGPLIYGWVFAGHQLGGGAAAAITAWSRDVTGSFQAAFVFGGVAALITAFACLRIGQPPISGSAALHSRIGQAA
jgi:MFS family permease